MEESVTANDSNNQVESKSAIEEIKKSNNAKKQISNNTMTTTSRLKYGWRNFFSNMFATKHSSSKLKISRNVSKKKLSFENFDELNHENEEMKQVIQKVVSTLTNNENNSIKSIKTEEDTFLNNIKDQIALAIALPIEIKGKYVDVAIELEALSTGQEESLYEKGMYFVEETSQKTVFSGIIKVPPNITLNYIANMPLYFVNSTSGSDCNFKNRIERVVRPMDNVLPPNVKKETIVEAIYLKIKLNHTPPKRIRLLPYDTLAYKFLGKVIAPKMNDVGKKESKIKSSDCPGVHKLCYEAEQIVQKVIAPNKKNIDDDNDDDDKDERSRTIVKEILSHVMNRVHMQDISTQYSKVITNVNKEIDVQKSLLLKSTDVIKDGKLRKLQFMPEISERGERTEPSKKRSMATIYPRSSTSFISTTTFGSASVSESNGSVCFLKVPNNSPLVQQPRFVIRYDSTITLPPDETKKIKHDANVNYISIQKYNSKPKYKERPKVCDKKRFISSNAARDEIDRTLDLLETARVKLITYLKHSPFSDLDISDKNIPNSDTEQSSACELIPLQRTESPIKIKEHRRHKSHHRVEAPQFNQTEHAPEGYKQVTITDASGNKQFFLDEGEAEKVQKISLGPAASPIQDKLLMNTQSGPKLPTIIINTLQNIYSSHISIDCQSAERTKSQILRDHLYEERYSKKADNDIPYAIVENDINQMIQDLLSESYTIKELAFAHDIPIDSKGEPLLDFNETSTSAVKSILNDLINVSNDKTEYCIINESQLLIGDLPQPTAKTSSTNINYCIIDERIKEDKTKALVDINDKCKKVENYHGKFIFSNPAQNIVSDLSKVPKTSWNFGESCCNQPVIILNQISSSKDILESDDNLEKGCNQPVISLKKFNPSKPMLESKDNFAFISEIYEEICTDTIFDTLSNEYASTQCVVDYDHYSEASKISISGSDYDYIGSDSIVYEMADNALIIACDNDDPAKATISEEAQPESVEQPNSTDIGESDTENVIHKSEKIDLFAPNDGRLTPNADEEELMGITVITDFGKENIFAPLLSQIDPTIASFSMSQSEHEHVSDDEDSLNSKQRINVIKTPTHLISNSNSEIIGAEKPTNTQNITIKARPNIDDTPNTSKDNKDTCDLHNTIDDSDSDDGDTYTFIFPQLKEEYISIQEFNNKDEIEYIDKNIEKNKGMDQHLFHSKNIDQTSNDSFTYYDSSNTTTITDESCINSSTHPSSNNSSNI